MSEIINVGELKARLCAIEREALLALDPSIVTEAYPRWFAKPETFPYWLNRVQSYSAEEAPDDMGEEGEVYVAVMNAMLVVAHVTSDIAGESDDLLDVAVPQFIEYLDARAHLQSADYEDAMLYLIRASFVTAAYTTMPTTAGVQAFGAAFQIRCEFRKSLDQAYL